MSLSADRESAAAQVLIVVPTLGRRPTELEQTLSSVAEQGVPTDVVLVAPTGESAARALARAFGANVVDDPGGLSSAINAGFRVAQPHHVLGNWLADDDTLEPDALAETTRVLLEHPDVAVAYGRCQYVDERDNPLWVSRAGKIAELVLPWGPDLIPQPGLLFRLADFQAIGGLDETLEFAMDLDLLLRLRRRGRFQYVPKTLATFRWHPDSLTVGFREASLAESEAVKKRYLPAFAKPISSAWELPVRWATRKMAGRLNARAQARRSTRLSN
jgi:GT2 family glycosyltransferase